MIKFLILRITNQGIKACSWKQIYPSISWSWISDSLNRINQFFEYLARNRLHFAGGGVHKRKIAEKEVMEVKTEAERKRKTNSSIDEISLITESMRKNIDIIQSKLTNNITNK